MQGQAAYPLERASPATEICSSRFAVRFEAVHGISVTNTIRGLTSPARRESASRETSVSGFCDSGVQKRSHQYKIPTVCRTEAFRCRVLASRSGVPFPSLKSEHHPEQRGAGQYDGSAAGNRQVVGSVQSDHAAER